jgi:hypothetical protein
MKKLVLLSVALMVIMSITSYALEVNVALGKTYSVFTPFYIPYDDLAGTILTDGDTTYTLTSAYVAGWNALQSPRRINIDLGQILPSIDSVAITNFVSQGSGVWWISTGEVWGSSSLSGPPTNYAHGIVPTCVPPVMGSYNVPARFTDDKTPVIGGYASCVGWNNDTAAYPPDSGPGIKVATLAYHGARFWLFCKRNWSLGRMGFTYR